MSFKDSVPGTTKGVAKAIKTVTATRNPNRPQVKAATNEELAEERKEKDEQLLADFKEMNAREFASKSSAQQNPANKLNQMAMLAAMQNAGGGSEVQTPKMPSIPANNNQQAKPNNNSKSTQGSNTHNLEKPNLVDNQTKNPQQQGINPLRHPSYNQGQNQNSNPDNNNSNQANTNQDSTRSSMIPLPTAINQDINRISSLANNGNTNQQKADAQRNLHSYTNAQDKHSLSEDQIRRLVVHGIPFQESLFKTENTKEENQNRINDLISKKNETALAALGQNRELASHYKEMGFRSGDYSQLSAKQFRESFEYIDSIRNGNGNRSQKQALVLLPEKGAAEFDMTREVEDLKRLGYTPVFAQIHHENSLQLRNEDGSMTPIKKLASDLGGFDLVVMGGHGQSDKSAGIMLGDYDQRAAVNPALIAQAEKSFLDPTDFRRNSQQREFFEDKGILKDSGTFASCSCSFIGSDPSRSDYIKPEESMAALIKDIRPDLDIIGAFDEVGVNGKFFEMDGKLAHTTMRELGEEALTTEDILNDILSENETNYEDSSDVLKNLDDIFADDDEDIGLVS